MCYLIIEVHVRCDITSRSAAFGLALRLAFVVEDEASSHVIVLQMEKKENGVNFGEFRKGWFILDR